LEARLVGKISPAHGQLIEGLVRAGWARTELSLTLGAADLTYENSKCGVYVHRPSIGESTLIQVTWAETGDTARVIAEDKGEVARLIEILLSWQDQIDQTEYDKFVDEIVAAYPDTKRAADSDASLGEC
jgi:hypothetical protein